MSDDPVLELFASLRYHATVFPRFRAVMPHGTVKGISEQDALTAVAEHGGHVEQSEVWLLPTGHEVLGPWLPIPTDDQRSAA